MLDHVTGNDQRLPLPVIHKDWPDMPQFHGLVYDDVALVGQWDYEGNYMTVDTPIAQVTHKDAPGAFTAIMRAFQKAPLHI